MILRLLTALAALLLGLAPVAAQAPAALTPRGAVIDAAPPPRGNTIAAALVVADAAAPGGGTMLAVQMVPRAGWHGYWINPGDAGLPLTVEWDAPPGITIGDLRFPTPDTYVVQGIMNHVYYGDYAVLADVRVADGMAPGAVRLTGRARWLSCSDSLCVPEQAVISAAVMVGSGGGAADPRFGQWQAAMPVALDRAARHTRRGGRLEIAIPWPADAALANAAPHLFTHADDLVAHSAGQRFRRSGDWLIASVEPSNDGAPARIDGLLRVGDAGRGFSFVSTPGDVPTGGAAVGSGSAGPGGPIAADTPLALLFGAALFGGLLLNLMPCVFPILGLKALSLAKAGGTARAARADSLAYLAGSLATCLALGGLLLALRAGGAELGWAFQLQDPRAIFLLLLLMVAVTANLAGLFELPSLGGRRAAGGRTGSFSTGALAAFIATPCTGPFMAAALGAALVLPWQGAMLIFAGLGIGLALPFVAIAFIEPLRRALPRPGPWLARFRLAMAVPMGLAAAALAWLLWRQAGGTGLLVALGGTALLIAALAVWRARQRGLAGRLWPRLAAAGLAAAAALVMVVPVGTGAAAPTGDAIGGEPFTPARLAELDAAGTPMFVYFTADWCITCKANEAVALNSDAVRAALTAGGVAVLRGDFTRADPAIAAFLAAEGRSGIPYYLVIGRDGRRQVLPQLLTESMVIAAVRNASAA